MDEAGTGELRTGTRLVSESSRLPVFASVLKWLPRISRFFLAALFQPERAAFQEQVPPLVSAFVRSAVAQQQAAERTT